MVERTVVERTVVERTVVETTSGGKHTSHSNVPPSSSVCNLIHEVFLGFRAHNENEPWNSDQSSQSCYHVRYLSFLEVYC